MATYSDDKIIFTQIGKTGSISIVNLLVKEFGFREISKGGLSTVSNREIENRAVITGIRNPWVWHITWWYTQVNTGDKSPDCFHKWVKKNSERLSDTLYRANYSPHRRNSYADHYIRTENLEEDLAEALHLGYAGLTEQQTAKLKKLKHRNSSIFSPRDIHVGTGNRTIEEFPKEKPLTLDHKKVYYRDSIETVDLIAESNKWIIDRFNYTPDFLFD